MKELTLCIIKPDAVSRSETWSILRDIEEVGIQVVQIKKYFFSEEAAIDFYSEHCGKHFFPGLVEFMSSGPCYVAVLSADNVVERYRRLMGNTDPVMAESGTLRGDYGTACPRNAVHGSDSIESAQREIDWFGFEYEGLLYGW